MSANILRGTQYAVLEARVLAVELGAAREHTGRVAVLFADIRREQRHLRGVGLVYLACQRAH